MQKTFTNTLLEFAASDKRIMMLSADNGTDYDKYFKRELTNQYIDVGIAEASMVGIAAGLSSTGLIPFVQTNSSFLTYRALEFIRNDVCMQNQNVKLVGTGCGLSISNLGPTHHSTEDYGILKLLPNLTIFSPGTIDEAALCIKEAYIRKGPVYVRLGVSEGSYPGNDCELTHLENGCRLLREGGDILMVSTGSIWKEAFIASEELSKKGISSRIISINTIKPFPREAIIKYISERIPIVTIEEHSVNNGIGDEIKKILYDNKQYNKLVCMGLKECFAKGYGSIQDIRYQNGLSSVHIIEYTERLLYG